MTIQFSFSVVLLLTGIVAGLLAMLILLTEKANKRANRLIAGLVLVCVGTLLHNFLLAAGIYNNYPFLYFLPVIASLGVGPLLFLYINSLTGIKKIPASHTLLHLLPMILQCLAYMLCFVQNTADKYLLYIDVYEPWLNPVQIIGTYISIGLYGYLSWSTLHQFKTALSDFYTDSHIMVLGWLRKLLLLFLGHYALSIVFILVAYLFKTETPFFLSDITRSVIIFVIAIFASRQNSLLLIRKNVQEVNKLKNEQPGLVQPSPPAETFGQEEFTDKPKEVNAALLQQIIALVEEEQLYLNEELTVADVASKLGYSARTISFTVNNGLQKSFSLFINEYRVQLFKERKLSGKYDHLSIMGLAYDCGFNSKSTFNRMYKEITGAAPKNLSA